MKLLLNSLVVTFSLVTAAGVQAMDWLKETPSLVELVESGKLPPIDDRIPQDAQVAQLRQDQVPGEHGGEMRLLMGKQKDIRQIVIYGYARLVGYTPELELKPDILKSVDIVENRIFTLHLRKGHKWSDGHPFTSEDFRYLSLIHI